MKKRLWVMSLLLALMLMTAPIFAGAVGNGTVSGEQYTGSQDGWLTYVIYADELVDVAAMDMYVFYDSSVFTVHDAWGGELLGNSTTSINYSMAGQVVLSSVSVDGINGSGVLLYLNMQVAKDAKPGDYTIRIAFGEVYDSAVQSCTVYAKNGRITVQERDLHQEAFYLWGHWNNSYYKKGESAEFYLYNNNVFPFVSGDFTITYDPKVFAVEEVILNEAMTGNGGLHSINTATPGEIRITYASLEPVEPHMMATIRWRVVTEADVNTEIGLSAKQVIREDLQTYGAYETSFSVDIMQNYEEERQRSLWLWMDSKKIGQEAKATAALEAGAKVAAGDFVIHYDPSLLECVRVEPGVQDDPNIIIIINENFAEGTIRFSYLNLSGKNEKDLNLVEITFVPRNNPSGQSWIGIEGNGVVDLNMQPVPLWYNQTGFCVYETLGVVEPGCYQSGYTEYQCICCGAYSTGDYIDGGHQWGEWYTATEATCIIQHVEQRDCLHCGAAEYQYLGYGDHSWSITEVAPTCYSAGYTAYHCNHCGWYEERDYVDALGHAWGAWYTIQEPTCTWEGIEQHDCTRCGAAEYQYLGYGDHNWSITEVAPTCYSVGYTAYHCNHCGWYEERDYVDALDHAWGTWYTVQEPTCIWEGIEQHDCAQCGTSEIQYTGYGDHSYTITVIEPTCETGGCTRSSCIYCGSYTEWDYVEALGHDWESWYTVTTPTCVTEGKQQRDCARCGIYEHQYIGYGDHSYTITVIEPTCETGGCTRSSCIYCGSYTEWGYVEALGHDWESWYTVTTPTCVTEGKQQRDCARCGIYEHQYIGFGDHSYTITEIEPTCETPGCTCSTCVYCGSYTEWDYVEALGHDIHHYAGEEPTCEKPGWHEYEACSRCAYSTYMEIPATGHQHTFEVVDPTCTQQGYTLYTCHCGDSYQADFVEALGHTYGNWYSIKDPTCMEEGQRGRNCDRCGNHEVELVAKVDHSFTKYISDGNATTEADGTKTAHCDYGCGATHTIVDEGSKITDSQITSDIFEVTDQYIGKIGQGTTVEELLEGIHERACIKVFKDDKEVEPDALVGTGMVVRLVIDGQVIAEVEVVVTGDTSGDGMITITDMLVVKAHVLKKSTLEGAYAKAADTSADGGISITDFIQVKAHILGKSEIKPASQRVSDVRTMAAAPAEPKKQTPAVAEQLPDSGRCWNPDVRVETVMISAQCPKKYGFCVK